MFQFVGNGRWIKAHDPSDSDQMVHLFSAENGQPVAKLRHPTQSRFQRLATNLGTGGRTAAASDRRSIRMAAITA